MYGNDSVQRFFYVLHLDLLSLSVICLLSATSQYSSTVSSTLSCNPRQTSASQGYGRVIPCRMASNAHAALLHSLYQALSRFFLKLFDSTRQFSHSALNRIGNRRFADPLRFRNFNITHAKNIAGLNALRLFIRKHRNSSMKLFSGQFSLIDFFRRKHPEHDAMLDLV